jgi:hypothetical protein
MIFAEFYHNSTGWNGKDFSGPVKLIPACGDRSIIIFSPRYKLSELITLTRNECQKRGFAGFTLNRGNSLLQNSQIRELEVIS